MNAVVDTNVIAYQLLGTEEFHAETTAFWARVNTPLAPALWEAEISNVIWMSARQDYIDEIEAVRRLGDAGRLGIRSVSSRSLWHGALVRSTKSDVSPYDTLFVELAARERLPLATYDRRLLERFPEIAVAPSELIA